MLFRGVPLSGPDGAEGCSHGWSSPKANGTRGTVTTRPARPGGAEDGPTASRRSIQCVTRLARRNQSPKRQRGVESKRL